MKKSLSASHAQSACGSLVNALDSRMTRMKSMVTNKDSVH